MTGTDTLVMPMQTGTIALESFGIFYKCNVSHT